VLALQGFDLGGKRRADVRHAVASARRLGLEVVGWSPSLADQIDAISQAWLATKRGGEMGFTLGRLDGPPPPGMTFRAVVNRDATVFGFVTWHCFDSGRGRVLDVMRRRPDAPNPTMDFLIARCLADFATVPGRHHLPGALRAVARAYCPGGLAAALRHNR
jgi:phosphatidylglycerol lysyltransferase